jgi:hypothetical protein
VSGEKRAVGQLSIHHVEMPLDFANITIGGVGAVGMDAREVVGLSCVRADAGGGEHEPGQDMGAVCRCAKKFSRLLREVKQNGVGIEEGDGAVRDGWDLAVRVDRTVGRAMLLALEHVDADDFIGQAGFLEHEGDFRGVRCVVIIELDHGKLLRSWLVLAVAAKFIYLSLDR